MARFEPIDRSSRMPVRQLRRRSHRGLALLFALGVMALSAGGLWIGYKLSSHRLTEAEAPVLHADNQPIKVRPQEPGGMKIPNRDRFVFGQKGDPVERLLPPPETPLPRPQQTEVTVPLPPPAPTPTPTLAPSIATAPPVAPPAPAQSLATIAPTAPPPAPPPPPAAPQQSAALPPTPAPGGKGYRLQVGSVKSADAAKEAAERIKKENGDLLGSLSFVSERADLGDRGVFYRIQSVPIANAAEAERLCGALKQRKLGCIIVKP